MSDLIAELRITPRRLEVEADPALSSRFLNEVFMAEYDDSVDLERLPDAVVLVPFLLNIAPVVWVSGRRYAIDTMDEDLAASLAKLREICRANYPKLDWDGEIVPRRLVRVENAADRTDQASLFSGGVDSIYTALAADPPPSALVTIWGADINLANETGWRAIRDQAHGFAAAHGREVVPVRSNFREFLNASQLQYVDPSIPDWWAYVQHGMGLLGVTAPILASRGLARILIAATHTDVFATPWGSSPEIDSIVTWSGVKADHHGFEASRQDKVRFIASLAEADPPDRPLLRVCYEHPGGSGRNCGRCEKCLRTATGLLIEGQDSQAYGFPLTADEAAVEVRSAFETGRLRIKENQVFMWQDIQARATQRLSSEQVFPAGLDRYLGWLCEFDFEAYSRRSKSRGRLGAAARRTLARFPRTQRAARRLLRH